jgi:hypothetical protein
MLIEGLVVFAYCAGMEDFSVETIPTEIEGIEAFKPLPEDMSVETATVQELRRYGFPARPDNAKFPGRYTTWKRRISCKQIQPRLVQTDVSHGPARIISKTDISAANWASAVSPNWSGIVIVDAKNPFAQETDVQATWAVPKPNAGAYPPAGLHTCSQWVGIDGYGSNNVLQAGTSADFNAVLNDPYPPYAWIEWFPNNEVQISNLPVMWGDEITASVAWWPSQSRGIIHVSNLSQNGKRVGHPT